MCKSEILSKQYSRCAVSSIVSKWQVQIYNKIICKDIYRYSPRFKLPGFKASIHFTSILSQGKDHWNLKSKNGFIVGISNSCFLLIHCHPMTVILRDCF